MKNTQMDKVEMNEETSLVEANAELIADQHTTLGQVESANTTVEHMKSTPLYRVEMPEDGGEVRHDAEEGANRYN